MSTETQVGAPDVFEEQQRGVTLAGLWLGSLERRRDAGPVAAREDISVGRA
jgi:hypothetical protein